VGVVLAYGVEAEHDDITIAQFRIHERRRSRRFLGYLYGPRVPLLPAVSISLQQASTPVDLFSL